MNYFDRSTQQKIAQDMDQWLALANMRMNLQVLSWSAERLLASQSLCLMDLADWGTRRITIKDKGNIDPVFI
jgi:hypothetical protein